MSKKYSLSIQSIPVPVNANGKSNWMKLPNNTGERLRSTRAIASWNNLTEDRVRYVASIHKKIFLSTGKKEDMWTIYDRKEKSVYEERGIRTL